MLAEIITIGDEILIGQTINSNAGYIGGKMLEAGLEVRWITTIGDNEKDLLSALEQAEKRADVIISTGGLGPTHDDMTKNVFAKYFCSELILNEHILDKIRTFFDRRGVDMPIINEEQALIPHNAEALENDYGTAPGLMFRRGGKLFFVLPGVPVEMKALIDSAVFPMLKNQTSEYIKFKKIKTFGIGESALFEKLGNIEEYEQFVSVAFLPKIEGVEIRLTAKAKEEKHCLQKISQAESLMRKKIQEHIWGVDEDSIEDIVARRLISEGKSLSLIELSTGGNVADKFTNHLSSSKFLQKAMIFSDKKRALEDLGIDQLTGQLDDRKLAELMSSRLLKKTSFDYCLATLGEMMPSSPDKFGLIIVAISHHSHTHSAEMRLKQDRVLNKARAANFVLNEFLKFLDNPNHII